MSEKRANIEIIASSLEDAVEEGLEKLGLPEDAVEIEILDEGTKGLFGLGSRQTRIRLTVKSEESQDYYIESDEKESVDLSSVKQSSGDIIDDEDHDVKVARETVSELLERMNISAEVTAERGVPDDDRSRSPVLVTIQGDDLSILIGRKAETLNALQFITKLIAGKELEKSIPLSVDVEGYRKRRELQIRQLANRVADQVQETRRSQALEPMPPNERRIIHIELRNNPKVYTESTGEGHRRKVVINPED